MSAPNALGADDLALVNNVLARLPGAFEQLVRRYQRLCWHVISRMIRNPEDARELCQEAFLRVYQQLHQYRFEATLATWIAQIAYSIALRHLERKRIPLVEASGDEAITLLDQVSDDFDLENASADSELLEALYAAIEALPPLQRMILTLYHLDELQIADIALITGLAEGTIKSHLFRSRARLREHLNAHVGVPQ